ncbi:MAG: hypothetical protein UU80_C0009G0012 [candidate division WWE3 bacterium GW2011_GWA1_41_8]|uniref:NAD-dependent epimerase/dehydratase domain-containing protein n=1 Tax=candidate division WWE3 bacterium GW2011_GWA1_41_8 TaxID=1619103 RepID=A0A0G0XBN3_UNCKA|nr:MAG: hypothetical protein UU80_C0009G0012 [candidate division WWE3 bacterium GW2011_GWA1_41_8]
MPRKNVIRKSALSPTVLIAGGAGFIGSHLSEALLLQDARVIVLDNFKTGRDFYIGHLLTHPKFALYDADINVGFPPEIESVDYVIHLAGLEEYLYSEEQVNLDALLTNAVGTKNLLDLANRSHAKFLLASSIYVYQGMMSQITLDSYFGRTNIEEKKYSATEAKRYAEALVWEYYKKNDTNVRIMRLPEVYGPKMDLEASGNLGRLLKELMDGKDLNIYGEGVEKEHYVYVNDVVSGIVRALFNDRTVGKIYSLIPPEPYSVLEIAFLLKTLANREIKVEFKQKIKEMEPRQAYPDTSNLKDLRWEIKTSFKDGIIKTLMWYGYDVNQHSFKPAKFIEEKNREKTLIDSLTTVEGKVSPEAENELISSLSNVAEFHTPEEIKGKKEKKPFPLAEAIKGKISIFKNLFKKEGRSQTKPQSIPPAGKSRNKIMLSIVPAVLFALILLTVGIPSFMSYAYAKKATSDIREVPVLLSQFKTTEAQTKANSAFQNFSKSQRFFSQLGWAFSLTGNRDMYNSSSKVLSSATYSSRAAYYFSKAAVPFSSMWETIKPNSEKEFSAEEFEKYRSDFQTARNSFQLAQAEYKNVDKDDLPGPLKEQITEYENILSAAGQNLDLFADGMNSLPDIIGIDSSKKYLILFQNNNELRPTGGFIGSYALLELEKGKIKNLSIDDIYNPDGQIDVRELETPESPAPIKEFLKEEKLYLRNANWNPSFPQSAREIQDLYYLITGTKTDGVIAVDLYFAKNMLDVTGPLFLTAYNEEISASNLYERTQFHSEFNYENGSDQKRSFLTVLGSKLLEKMFALPSGQLPVFWSKMYENLEQRHMQIYLTNNPFGAVLQREGWDGSLAGVGKDYLYIVNSNLGGNKANYFVRNTVDYNIMSETRDGLLRGNLTLTYEHTGEGTAWPGGIYTNYVRILTQEGSKLTGARIVYPDREEDIFGNMIITKAGKYNSFETPVLIEPQKRVQLKVTYDLPIGLSINANNMNYSLFWQKQPGTQDDKFSFKFEPPFGLETGQSSFDGTLTGDKQFNIALDPK